MPFRHAAFSRLSRIPHIGWAIAVALTLVWLLVYLLTVSPSVNFIDSGELITALHEPGIPHPPGYPLYALMGYVVSHLLWGEVAWRVNVLSAFWAAMAVGAFYVLIWQASEYITAAMSPKAPALNRRKGSHALGKPGSRKALLRDVPEAERSGSLHTWSYFAVAAACASLLGASASFWSRATQAKMYSLHFFLVTLAFLLAIKYRAAYERENEGAAHRFLLAMSAALGFSFTNHLMTSLLGPGLALILIAGGDWRGRLRAVLRRLPLALAAFALPLLLYLYLPLRASQEPVMNWGSPNNWGDFWRHVTGWQYTAYFLIDVLGTFGRLVQFVAVQWQWLTFLALPLSLGGAFFLGRASRPLFAAILVTAVLTSLFAVAYGISEVEPYMVPFYMMLLIWLGGGAAALLREGEVAAGGPRSQEVGAERERVIVLPAILAFLALVSAVTQFPRQDRSNDRLAEQFVMNVFDALPQGSIIITDYWDFYAPTYYLQQVRGVRPDLAIVNTSLLKYPWYSEQLDKRHPWLVEKSRDILDQYRVEQRKWVNGEQYDAELLNNLYFALVKSFVSRHLPGREVYTLYMAECGSPFPPSDCESAQVAQGLVIQPMGLVNRLRSEPPPDGAVPPEPDYKLRGITQDRVPLDDVAILNTMHYLWAYEILAAVYRTANMPEEMGRMLARAAEIRAVVGTP